MALSAKQQAFVEFYLQTHSVRKAAVLADYPASAGSRVKNTPAVQEEINARLAERRITTTEVLDRLASLVRSTPRDFITVAPDGTWSVDIAKAFETGAIDAITEIKQKRGGLTEIKKVETLKALITAAKMLGMDSGELGEDERAWYEALEDDQ